MQSPVLIAPLTTAPLPASSLLAPCPLLPSALARLWSRGRGGEDEQSSRAAEQQQGQPGDSYCARCLVATTAGQAG
jgi:hypothetical protein